MRISYCSLLLCSSLLLIGCDVVPVNVTRHAIDSGSVRAAQDPCAGIASAGAPGLAEQDQCVLGSLGVAGDITGHGGARVDGVVSIGGDVVLDAGANIVLQGGGRVVIPPQLIQLSTLPVSMVGDVTSPSLVTNPTGIQVGVWRMPGRQVIRARIDGWNSGDTVDGVQIDLLGDGVIGWQFFLEWSDSISGLGTSGMIANSGPSIVPRAPTSWTRYDMAKIGMVTPTMLPFGANVLGTFILSGGGSQVYLGNVHLHIRRQ